ncbi:MAG: hypothetical protein ACREBS_06545 [Nitrososphaerales archaeon]
MSNENSQQDDKKKYAYMSKYMPKYYKMKPLPKPSPLQTGFVNRQQKMFYVLLTSFRVAKILAVVVLALLIIGRL